MQHLSEVAHILRAALDGDIEKARSYAELLASKLTDDGEMRQAHILRCILHDIPQPMVGPSDDDSVRVNGVELIGADAELAREYFDWLAQGRPLTP